MDMITDSVRSSISGFPSDIEPEYSKNFELFNEPSPVQELAEDKFDFLEIKTVEPVSESDGDNQAEANMEGFLGDIKSPNLGSGNGDRKVGMTMLPEQRKHMSYRKGGHFTMMVAGPAGTGKTTFINTLFGSDLLQESHEPVSTKKITIHQFELEENGFPLRLTAIDTPGFGQSVNNQYAWAPITKFIDNQFRLHLFQEEQPEREKLYDTRVHCCLYFISPNNSGLSHLDVASMKELSKRVNLIPVIAKSDTFSTDDLRKFKRQVKETLRLQDIKTGEFIVEQSLRDSIKDLVPFAIIGSNEYHERNDGQLVKGRKYKWGIAEIENKNHCDFVLLRDILMGKNLLDLVLSTETHYENYRRVFLYDRFKESIKNDGLSEEELQKIHASGLEEYKRFHKISLEVYEESTKGSDPVLVDKQQRMKEKFAIIVSNQEKRFKEWKKALVDKQNTFNNDIEKLHNRIVRLQDIIDHFEAGYYYDDESTYDDETCSDLDDAEEGVIASSFK
ncbi:Piso0_001121 [Millerozyma farinosa CBS 7064]|uniref:Piso0_001121 protein n=1 Tax=Pichia sorbitophila (strain ATCC MYA-4447 / BCRC 22081 / CBS 7064 / NBRC 10061 / NRRL Y-12695) TaxID=559304 RepID=G8YQZ9_PICSO|nr:Piso0_001121 [Millerozyma farinosa CBS 7064]CCE79084.1 Piso0_001121 [Millerozyma farinosa CBS 7064]